MLARSAAAQRQINLQFERHPVRPHLAAVGQPRTEDVRCGDGKNLWLSQVNSKVVDRDTPIPEQAAFHALLCELMHRTPFEPYKF